MQGNKTWMAGTSPAIDSGEVLRIDDYGKWGDACTPLRSWPTAPPMRSTP